MKIDFAKTISSTRRFNILFPMFFTVIQLTVFLAFDTIFVTPDELSFLFDRLSRDGVHTSPSLASWQINNLINRIFC